MYKKILHSNLFLFITIIIASCHNEKIETEIVLSNWEFREKEGEWMPASVPGFVHLDLFNNNLIDDPFYRDNENKQQWIQDHEWEYRTQFKLDRNFLKNNNIFLDFSGIDTYAKVYLNDSLIKTCTNFFVSHSIDATSLLTSQNELRFVFQSTNQKTKEITEKASYNLPGNDRVYARKPQFHFGWDWGPKLLGCGITEDVKLITKNTIRIDDYYIKTLAITDNVAHMSLELNLAGINNESLTKYSVEILGKNYPLDAQNPNIEFSIEDPQLWYPKGYGNQSSYSLEIKLNDKHQNIVDKLEATFAIQQIKLIQEEDELGKGFKFRCNGVDVYAKGANWIPLDYFHSRVDSNDYREALFDIVDANMNMLRVWGGGLYEDEYFYELCDSLGILVWQDFMFACAMYPGDSTFMNNVELEATQQIKRLRKHPSIALWCGNNENSEGWHRWGWQTNRTDLEKESIWEDYQNLFNKLLPNLVDSLSHTDYWESSPQYGRGNPKHQFTGDAHYWGVWHDAEPFENFETKVPRFMSEYGFQSFPEFDALELYMLEQDYHLDSDVMKVHQKHPRGNSLIQEYILRDYKAPADFESFIYLSQILQAEGMRMGMEAHRRSRPYNMGTLYWQFNDCWPVASWSSRDYYGNWKALHYHTKKAYEDLLVSSRQINDSIYIYIVNDNLKNIDLDLLIEHVDYKGNILSSTAISKTAKSSTSIKAYQVALEDYLYIDSLKNNSYLNIQLLSEGEVKTRKLHHFVKPKDMTLPYSGISYKVDRDSIGFVLELFSDGFIKNLHIKSLHDGRFEDNYFDLPANELRRIRFINEYPMDEFNDNNLTFFSVVDTY